MEYQRPALIYFTQSLRDRIDRPVLLILVKRTLEAKGSLL